MFNWFRNNLQKLRDDLQAQNDKKAGFKNAVRNKYYRGYEIAMSTGETLRMTADQHSCVSLNRVSTTRTNSRDAFLSLTDRRVGTHTVTRETFSVDGQKYFKDQIVKVRRYTVEEEPKWVTKEEN